MTSWIQTYTGRGSELSSGYFLDSIKYCQSEEDSKKQISLFDFDEAVNA